MRLFLDENIPRALRYELAAHDVSFVEEEGWKAKKNGELLALVERGFDVLITSDGSLPFRNDPSRHRVSVIVLPTNKLPILRANAAQPRATLWDLLALAYPALIVIAWNGLRMLRRLNGPDAADHEIEPVAAFGSVQSGI